MAYQFRYEALFSYRKHLKERAETELWKTRQKLKQTRASLKSLTGEYHRMDRSLRVDLSRRIAAHELKTRADYMAELKERIARQASEISHWERIVEEKRDDLLKKSKDYKTMEKLKEKDFQIWEARQNLLEQKRLNEIGVQRHRRESLG